MYRMYGDRRSGNCYKIELLMSYLELEYEWVDVDILAGETRTTDFSMLNLNAKIPVLDLPGGQHLAESNAILNYLADGTEYLPSGRLQRAYVLQWQFFEQYSHEPYIAVARFIAKYLGMPASRREEFDSLQAGGHKALAVMEKHLETRAYFVNYSLTIADIALYAYTHVAHEGGFDLAGYPAIRAWLDRVAEHPRHVAMADVPGPAAAGAANTT
jgi:glutathione S-transferase